MTRIRSAALFATLLTATSLGLAQATQSTAPASRPSTGQVERPMNLHRTMERIERTLKRIAAQVEDPKQDASTLLLLNELQASTVAAKAFNPDNVGELTGDARARMIADYRARMIAVLKAELTLEEAILGNDRPAAKAALATLQKQREDGHKAYDVDDHHH
jgi:type II secretory pathway component PulJ